MKKLLSFACLTILAHSAQAYECDNIRIEPPPTTIVSTGFFDHDCGSSGGAIIIREHSLLSNQSAQIANYGQLGKLKGSFSFQLIDIAAPTLIMHARQLSNSEVMSLYAVPKRSGIEVRAHFGTVELPIAFVQSDKGSAPVQFVLDITEVSGKGTLTVRCAQASQSTCSNFVSQSVVLNINLATDVWFTNSAILDNTLVSKPVVKVQYAWAGGIEY
jgi:hypothetical protein